MKKNIYIIHSTKINYKQDIYEPLINSSLNNNFEFIYPHLTDKFIKSKEIIRNCDIVLAFMKNNSIGMGIELGWADAFDKRIVFLNDSDEVSMSVSSIVKERIYRYNKKDIAAILDKIL